MLTQLNDFLSNPKQFFENYKTSTPIKSGLCMLYLCSLSLASFPSYSISNLWTVSIITFIVLNLLLFVQTVTLDFLAQVLKLTPKSYTLFFWLCISLSPLCLLPALTMLNMPSTLPIAISIITFQIWVLKNQYDITTKKAIILYTLPLACPVLLIILLSITL
jgi:hypothetical protein